MTQAEAQERVLKLINSKLYTRKGLANTLKKSSRTISNRIDNGDWRQKEINLIKEL